MASAFDHIYGLGKKTARTIWPANGPTSTDIEALLAHVSGDRKKTLLRGVVSVVYVQPRLAAPPAPAPRSPYGAIRGGGSPQPLPQLLPQPLPKPWRVGPYDQLQMNPTWKTRTCKYYEQGCCVASSRSCCFAHGANDMRARYCKFFLEGNAESCPGKSSGQCTFWHGTD